MVRTCCVLGCNVRSYDRHGNKIGLSFYAFPTWKQHEGALVSDITKRRRLAWIAAVRRADIKFCYVSRYHLVCSRHFHSDPSIYKGLLSTRCQGHRKYTSHCTPKNPC
uniref:THAP-type domain-containing protein n=1 Tax=Pundamilia nyererei TaxID=303518 RepID=A0A3B4EZD2_9CICH